MPELLGRALSPAKINYGLAILGKRPDGYHEIHTEMMTISLFDRISMYSDGHGAVRSNLPALDSENNLMSRAAHELATRTGRAVDVDFVLDKRIPIAAGLGGGSSNAASVLQLLCAHWSLTETDPRVLAAAAATGSDVPFFLQGGPARVTGRGELIERLAARSGQWLVIAAPELVIEQKTATLFRALNPEDYSPAGAVGQNDEHGERRNAFTRPLYAISSDVQQVGTRFQAQSGSTVHLSGAGPAHYAFCADLPAATSLLRNANRDPELAKCSFHLSRTLNGRGPLDMKRNGGQ